MDKWLYADLHMLVKVPLTAIIFKIKINYSTTVEVECNAHKLTCYIFKYS